MPLIGYVRTSTTEQDTGMELGVLTTAGAERVFLDAGQCGIARMDRVPQVTANR
ncbi:hypothetical protein CZ674_07355 [Agrococcus casei LMG 22410]|uniref:Resolvase/invertase-type recombinase catalytic domain-containing protein n=1 Tax=Agrococcus casei LMG 22410 TaxID=1255656 RepID=A0A1R4FXX5_9MICO|nr:hypothetical protein CZ674_07355 [Agrococcus casei LMG 22410]